MLDEKQLKGSNTEKKTFARNAIVTGATTSVSVAIFLWVQHTLLVNLHPEEFSIYPLIAIFAYLLPIFLACFSSPANRFVTQAYVKNKKREITEVVSTIVALLGLPLLLLIIGASILIVWMDVAFNVYGDNLRQGRIMLGIVFGASAIKMVLQPFCVGLYAKQRFDISGWLKLFWELFRVSLVVASFYLLGIEIFYVVLIDAIVSVAAVISSALFSKYLIPEIRFSFSSINWERRRELLGFGFFDSIIMISKTMRSSIPIFLLNRFDTPIAVNSYHVGQSAYRQSQKLWFPLRDITGPTFLRMVVKNQDGRLQRTFYRGGRISIWLTMLCAAPLIVFNWEVSNIYTGGRYEWAGLVMAILLARYPFQLLNSFLPHVARARGVPKQVSLPMLISEIISGIVAFLAIALWGCNLVTVALCYLVLTALFEIFIMVPIGSNLTGGNMRRALVEAFIPGIMPSLVSGVLMIILKLLFKPVTIMELTAVCIPSVILYILIVLCCFRKEDKDDAKKFYQWFISNIRSVK